MSKKKIKINFSDFWVGYNKTDNYFYNLLTAENIRKEFLKKHPQFNYCRVFSERRKNGVCRSKFWLVNEKNQKLFNKWMTRNYPWIEVKKYPSPFPWTLPSVAFIVG